MGWSWPSPTAKAWEMIPVQDEVVSLAKPKDLVGEAR